MVISLGWEASSSHGCQVCSLFLCTVTPHAPSFLPRGELPLQGAPVYIDFPNHWKGNALGAWLHIWRILLSSRENFHNVNWKVQPEQELTTVMMLFYFFSPQISFKNSRTGFSILLCGHLPQVIKLCKNMHCNSLRLQQCTVLKHWIYAVHIRGTKPTMPSQQGPEAFPYHFVGNKTTGRNPIVFWFTLSVLCAPCIKERLTKEFRPFKRESGITPETQAAALLVTVILTFV